MNRLLLYTNARVIVYGILGAVLVGGGIVYILQPKNNTGTTRTIVPADFIEQVSVSGNVVPAQDVTLGFAQSGRILAVYASVGQYVNAGALLAEVENGDLVAAVLAKKAALAQAQARLASLQAGTRPESIAVASSTVQNAQAALQDVLQTIYTTSDDAIHNKIDQMFSNPRVDPKLIFSVTNASLKTQVENDRLLMKATLSSWASAQTSGTVTAVQAQQYLTKVTEFLAEVNSILNQAVPDQNTSSVTLASYGALLATARGNVNAAVTSLTTASSALNSAQKNLDLLVAGTTADDITAQEAAVQFATADVQSAEAALAKTQIRAPFSGVVSKMGAKVGAIVSPTDQEITLQSDGIFEIDAYVPEVSIAGVAVGDVGSTTLDAYGASVVFPVKVTSIDPAQTIRQGVPTYKTTLVFSSKDSRIRSGMTANVVITIGVLKNAIVIPEGAVGHDVDGAYVLALIKEDTVTRRAVTVGKEPSFGQVEITSGLSAGDTILLTPR